jgi:DNA-binding FrmR family transcriptional regulator
MKVFLSLRGVFLMSHTQQNIPNCLAKIKSHVEGIYEVVEANRSCPDVITQDNSLL